MISRSFKRARRAYAGTPSNAINVYLLIGDSNQNGAVYEPVGLDSKYSAINSKVLIYYKPTRSSTDDGAWENYSTRPSVNRSPGNARQTEAPYAMGQDLSFAYKLGVESPVKSAIIKVAKGGSTLIAQTSTDNEWQKSAGELYTALVTHFYGVALPKLLAQGYLVTVKGAIIRLGTNDCNSTNWNEANFTAAVPQFVNNLRTDLSLPSLPIYWVQVRQDLGTVANYTQANVNAARQVLVNCATSGNPAHLSNFNLINYDSDTLQVDGVHFTAEAYLSQGEYEAGLMMAL